MIDFALNSSACCCVIFASTALERDSRSMKVTVFFRSLQTLRAALA